LLVGRLIKAIGLLAVGAEEGEEPLHAFLVVDPVDHVVGLLGGLQLLGKVPLDHVAWHGNPHNFPLAYPIDTIRPNSGDADAADPYPVGRRRPATCHAIHPHAFYPAGDRAPTASPRTRTVCAQARATPACLARSRAPFRNDARP